MEIIRVANGDIGRYEELILQREQLLREAFFYSVEYTRIFGESVVECFKLKIECISLKKSIAYVVAAKNRGDSVSEDELRDFIAKQMAAYNEQLAGLIDDYESAQKGRPITPGEAAEIKTVYRRIAKRLHPDISSLTEEYPELAELYQRAAAAYHCSDLKELQAAEVLINSFLDNLGIDTAETVIPNIDTRINELELEIESILTTEPYTYKDLLADAELVEKKCSELRTEIDEYKEYRDALAEQYRLLREDKPNG